MTHAAIAEILQRPVEERLRLVQIIRDSVAADTSAVPLGDTHRAGIDERLPEHEAKADDVATRSGVLAEARRR